LTALSKKVRLAFVNCFAKGYRPADHQGLGDLGHRQAEAAAMQAQGHSGCQVARAFDQDEKIWIVQSEKHRSEWERLIRVPWRNPDHHHQHLIPQIVDLMGVSRRDPGYRPWAVAAFLVSYTEKSISFQNQVKAVLFFVGVFLHTLARVQAVHPHQDGLVLKQGGLGIAVRTRAHIIVVILEEFRWFAHPVFS
jgi:hypothetical protein